MLLLTRTSFKPSDWVLQSLPFSFVSVEASSLDGQPHDVQVYSDISAGMSSVVCPKSGSQVSHHVHSVAVCHRPTSEAAHGIRDSALYVYSMCTPPPPPHPALSDLELVPVFQLSRRRHNVKVNLNRRRALVQRSHDTSPDSSPEY